MTTKRIGLVAAASVAALLFACAAPTTQGQSSPAPSAAPAASSRPTSAENANGRVLRAEDFRGLSWRSIGPANMSGRVAAIAIEPGNPKTFYVGFGTGGLWKTTNAGTTFSPIFDKEATSSIGAIAVADAPPEWPGWKDEPASTSGKPADPAKKGRGKIVWVGTGEGNGRNSSSWGNGVYRSTDAGSTFKHLGLADSHDIPAIAVDPRNPDICYVAALGHLWGPNKERGVYRTSDGGKTWAAVLQIDENTGCCEVIIDPQNPDNVYCAMYARRRTPYSFQSGGPEGGIYRSRDGGATWTKLTNGLPKQTGCIGLAVYAKNPQTLYAVVESDEGGWGVEPLRDDRSRAGGVFRSDDGGDNWVRQSPYTPRPFYFSKIRVDPTNDQRVYLLGFHIWVSDDAGKSFRAGGSRKPHVDHHAMVIDPQDTQHLILGNDGGIYISHDGARTWDFINTIAAGQFYNVAYDMSDPYRVGGGLQDNGSWIGPSGTIDLVARMEEEDAGEEGRAGITNEHWKYIFGGDGFHVAFDVIDPNIVYAESQGGNIARIHLDTGVRKRIQPSPKEGQQRFRFNWNSPFFVSSHEPTTLYLGGNYVFKLLDRGDRWERISDDLSTDDTAKVETVGSNAETHCTVVSLAESPLAAGLLWAGTDDGRVHVTGDGGKSWRDVTPPQVGGHYIAKIEPSHHDRDAAYVAIDGHRSDDMKPNVVATSDGGATWRSITGDLPENAPVKVVREDRRNGQVLYCGTEHAVYVTIDGGRHWLRLNSESLPTVPVDDLAQHPREMDLIAGTHGRSIWIMDDVSAISQLTPEVIASPLHAFLVQPAKPRLFQPYGALWTDRAFSGSNPQMGARITYWISEYTGKDVTATVEDSTGILVRKLKGSNRPGFNRMVWDLQRERYDRLPDPDARLNQRQFVPPGEYSITIKAGDHKTRTTVTVLRAPGQGS